MATSFGILSTYPPTQCGLATFSAALVGALRSPRDTVGVVGLVDVLDVHRPPEVRHQWVRGQAGGAAVAAAKLNGFDVVLVQHEYGIFGGPDGSDVLDAVRAVEAPIIVVLHTVLVTPTLRQKAILDELVLLADTVVTMTHTAMDRLIANYRVDPAKVRVIPHGAADTRSHRGRPATGDRPPVVLTWGLIGDGKGIEWGISAMAALRDIDPTPSYHVVGETHPKVVEREGERYREGLRASARALGVDDLVTFDGRYLETGELQDLVRGADVVLLPYDSRDQVTSGVLVEAVTAGKPVVSTAFPHAVELLSSGAGILVPRQDPAAIAAALRRVLTEPGLAQEMAAEAARIAPELLWSAVAEQYRDVAVRALGTSLARVSA